MSGDVKRLYRSQSNRMFLGVCGGLGEYFNVDPTIPRVAFVVLGALSLGTWLLIYLVMAFVIPEEPESLGDTVAATPEEEAAAAEEEPAQPSSAGESE